MKKIISLLLAVLMVLGISGCAQTNPENPAESVISRKISYDSLLVGAIPLFFVILGIILLFKSARELFLPDKEKA